MALGISSSAGLGLGAGFHVLHLISAFADLVLADDQGPGRPELARPAELALEPALLELEQAFDALRPQEPGQQDGLPLGLVAQIGDIDEPLGRRLRLDHGKQPFDSHGEADRADIRTAEIFHHVVVAAAAEDGVLGAEPRRCDLEGRFGVVVDAADETRLDPMRDPVEVQVGPELSEMLGAFRVEISRDLGESRGDLPAGLDLAVEDAERVGLRFPLTIGAERCRDGRRRGAQVLEVGGPAVAAAHRVDQDLGLARP